jgi:hypothetical protein
MFLVWAIHLDIPFINCIQAIKFFFRKQILLLCKLLKNVLDCLPFKNIICFPTSLQFLGSTQNLVDLVVILLQDEKRNQVGQLFRKTKTRLIRFPQLCIHLFIVKFLVF